MSEKNVKFLTKRLEICVYYSLFMTTVGNGIVSLCNFNDNIITIYYSVYTLSNLIICILLLIRFPYFVKEKNKITQSIHREEGGGIKNKLKIGLISLIFCVVTLSFYKIFMNEIFTSNSILLKAAKCILIILAALIVTVILYGIYLERMFERKYHSSVKVYLVKNRWREVTIILLYSIVIIYSFGISFQIWPFISLLFVSMAVFGFKNNGILLEYDSKLYYVFRNYKLERVKEIIYDQLNDSLLLEINNNQDKVEKINVDRVRDKKIYDELILLIQRYELGKNN